MERARAPRNQLVLIGAIFAAVVVLLAVGYFLFLRTEYVVLFEKLRPADAAAIVTDLDKRGMAYRLRDGGSTILVPADDADATRVAVAGSDTAARGQTGFELFNKSDMGLTNFAQKINFQRALQGELVRTITAMEGIEEARVHLALPERALFRGDRAEPKAAVTIAMKPGATADPARVAGIQQLVAAAVPDLPQAKVVVLDAGGRVISATPATMPEEARPADLEERAAVEGYYRARARGAVERQLPGLKFVARALVSPQGSAAPSAEWTPSGEGSARNFSIRILLVTEAALGPEDQTVVRDAVVQATGISEVRGDSLAFEVGPVEPAAAPPIVAPPPTAIPDRQLPAEHMAPAAAGPWGLSLWLLVPAICLALLLIVWFIRRNGAPRLTREDHEAFAAKLRRQLNLEAPDASA